MSADGVAYLLPRAVAGDVFNSTETEAAFDTIMAGQVDPIQLSAFLTALKMRGETTGELEGAVRAVRRHMTILPDVPDHTIDVCGTGGDGLRTLNVSTAVAFVLAGLGIPVAKHGNRALSSKTGATDVLEALGIPPSGDREVNARQLKEDGLVFLAAPQYHPAMRHAASVRKALGFRTLFNLLGPLCNPAQVRRQMIGVFDERWCRPVVETLAALGAECVWSAHGRTDEGGTDELTVAGVSHLCAWENATVTEVKLDPGMAGLPSAPISAIRGGDAHENATALLELLDGASGPYRDTVLLNAAVALHVAGRGKILANGAIDIQALRHNVETAELSLDQGLARAALERARTSARSLVFSDAGRS